MDWRYRIVVALDNIAHRHVGRDIPWLCNLERRMYWAKPNQRHTALTDWTQEK